MARRRKDCGTQRGSSSYCGLREKPVQRNAANARERARMRVLSKAFSRLKTTLPWVPADTKLSKLDTLRLAASYIAHLRQILLDENNDGQMMMIHPINLTWPFTFNAARAQDEYNAEAMHNNNNNNEDNCMSSEEQQDHNRIHFQYDNHHHHHHHQHHQESQLINYNNKCAGKAQPPPIIS